MSLLNPERPPNINEKLDTTTILPQGVIDAASDGHRWAESYDRELTVKNILDIQREMASSIFMALSGKLSTEEQQRLAKLPTESTRAYNFYLAGNYYLAASPSDETVMRAVEMYERAVAQDPNFARAYARLALAHLAVYTTRVDWSQSRLDSGEKSLRKAVDLDPDSAEVLLAQAGFEDDFERNLDLLRQARLAMPGNPEPALDIALLYRDYGDWEKALEQFDKIIELDPCNDRFLFFRGITHLFLRHREMADQDLDRVVAISPDFGAAYLFKLRGQLHSGRSIREMECFADSADVVQHLDEVNRMWFHWMAALYEREFAKGIQYLDHCNWDGELVYEQPHEYFPRDSLYGIMFQLAGKTGPAKLKFESARAYIEAQIESAPFDWRLQIALGEIQACLGRTVDAVKSARQGMEQASGEIDKSFARIEAIMRVFLPAEDYESVFAELDVYLASPGCWSIEGLLPNPRLDPIREDPRFQTLVDKYKRH